VPQAALCPCIISPRAATDVIGIKARKEKAPIFAGKIGALTGIEYGGEGGIRF